MNEKVSDILDLMRSMGTILGLLFYAAIVIWTYKDARKRIEDPILVACSTALSMLPIVGVLAYLLLRPSEYIADVRERALEIRLMERQLGSQQRCPSCRSHIEADYLSCPVCTTKLRESCESCDRPLDPRWALCPFCEAEVPGRTAHVAPAGGRGGRAATPPRPSHPARTDRPERSESPSRAKAKPAAPKTPRPAQPRETKPAGTSSGKGSGKGSGADSGSTKRSTSSDDAAKRGSSPAKGSDVRTEPFGPSGSTQRFVRSSDQPTMIGTTPTNDRHS